MFIATYRTGLLQVHFERHLTYLPYGIPIYTVRYVLFQVPYGLSSVLHFVTFLRTVRFVADYRTGLVFQIPYGISIATWEIYIATYRTGLSFEPYGITFIRPLRTTLDLSTVRDSNLHRTVCSFSGFLMMFLSTSRPYYNTKSS